MNAKHILWGAVLLGTAAGYVWSAVPPSAQSAAPGAAAEAAVAAPTATREQVEHSVYYAYCNEARAAGAAPIFEGQPGYRRGLDADGDGVACEPYRGG